MTPDQERRARELQFIGFVGLLGQSVMQHLGKTMNPFTKTVERNLEMAHATIEIIEMLQAKTKGNLSEEEERYLSSTLSTLRMNYVDEVRSAEQAGAGKRAEAASEQSQPGRAASEKPAQRERKSEEDRPKPETDS